jgi:hypothetical protein
MAQRQGKQVSDNYTTIGRDGLTNSANHSFHSFTPPQCNKHPQLNSWAWHGKLSCFYLGGDYYLCDLSDGSLILCHSSISVASKRKSTLKLKLFLLLSIFFLAPYSYHTYSGHYHWSEIRKCPSTFLLCHSELQGCFRPLPSLLRKADIIHG